MERKFRFSENEIYHVYNRGVEKRSIFNNDGDCERFLLLLLASNRKNPVRLGNILRSEQGDPLLRIAEGENLIEILAYALMPNHFHLIVKEKGIGGVSRFMLKLMTAYSMYFNTKNERSGPLFARPFRAKHVDSDAYFRWLWAYVHLNPVELKFPDAQSLQQRDSESVRHFLSSYKYSSYPDYAGVERAANRILARASLPIDPIELNSADALLKTLSSSEEAHEFASDRVRTLI